MNLCLYCLYYPSMQPHLPNSLLPLLRSNLPDQQNQLVSTTFRQQYLLSPLSLYSTPSHSPLSPLISSPSSPYPSPLPPPPLPSPPIQQGPYYIAQFDYTAVDSDEVSFQGGKIIINAELVAEGWMTGTVERTGHSGMLPSNYVYSRTASLCAHRVVVDEVLAMIKCVFCWNWRE